MSIVLFLQNLTQIFWSIIIALNLYVLVLLYRVSRLYRAERFSKLEATAFLKEQIACMRRQYLNSSTSGLESVNRSNPSAAAVGADTTSDLLRAQLTSLTNKKSSQRKRSREEKSTTSAMKPLTDLRDVSSSSSMHSNPSDDNPNNCHVEEQQHMLYISDSYGQVMHEIPFREQDYLEALCSVLGTSH